MGTRIGTPWTQDATRVALLGSGEIGKEVAIALTRLGVEVTAIDRYDGAPAQQVAHNALTVDMSDPVALAGAIRSCGAQIVVPEIEALATDALVELEAAGAGDQPLCLRLEPGRAAGRGGAGWSSLRRQARHVLLRPRPVGGA